MSTSTGSILLTGANGGIGGGIASEIIKSSYGVTHETIYVVRDPSKAASLKDILSRAPKDHKHEILALDLGSLASIRSFAADVNRRVARGALPPLQAIILNAGMQDVAGRKFTVDGLERTFGVNYLANFLLALLLLESMDRAHGRIVWTGSTSTWLEWAPNASLYTPEQRAAAVTSTRNMAKGIEEHPDGKVWEAGMRRYGMTKILMIMFMYELQRRLDADPKLSNISILAYDPGWVGATTIFRDQKFVVVALMTAIGYLAPLLCLLQENPLFRTPAKNGRDVVRACFDRKDVGEYPKALYLDGTLAIPTSKWANDETQQRDLWKGSVELAGITDGDTVLKNWR